MTYANATLEHCLDDVAQRAPAALSRCIDCVISILQQEEAKCLQSARRHELACAWRELSDNKALWCRQYEAELSSTFQALAQGRSRSAVFAQSGQAPLSHELSLVDDEQMLHAIEVSRVTEQLVTGLEQPISELDALVSTAIGVDSVRAELNPLHPDVFAQALRRLTERTPVQPSSRALWMQHLAAPLATELHGVYGSVARELRAAGVQPAHYGAALGTSERSPLVHQSELPVPHAYRGAPASVDTRGPSTTETPRPWSVDTPGPSTAGTPGPSTFDTPGLSSIDTHIALPGEQIKTQLLHGFLQQDSPAAAEPLPRAYYSQVLRELAQLHEQPRVAAAVRTPSREYRAQSPVDRPARKVDLDTPLDSDVWGQYADPRERSLVRGRLRSEAKQVGQVFGLEIVRRVVQRVAQDTLLLAPVREAIIACEPVLLRYAMVDPRFFQDPQNAGRQLIERVAQRSLRYNDEFSSEFASFFADVSESLKSLSDVEIDSAKPVEAALERLVARWDQEDQGEQAQRAKALDAVRFAEARQAEADTIAWELSARPGLEGAPALVQDFLYGPWALVLAHERLANSGQADPKGYRAAIDDLLWSVNREATLRSPARLFERVPALVATLRQGLACLGGPDSEHQPFFEGLMKLHRPVLKLRRTKLRRDAAASGAAVLQVEDCGSATVGAAAAGREKGQPWMNASDMDAAGFVETVPTDMGALPRVEQPAGGAAPEQGMPAATAAPAAVDGLAEEETLAIAGALQEGDWVDLYSRHRWRRAQLVWASAKRTLFMFVSHGGRPHSMTRRSCERLVRSRHLRRVASHEVVGRALESFTRAKPAGSSRARAADATGDRVPAVRARAEEPRPADRLTSG